MAKLKGFAERNRLFPGDPAQKKYIASLQEQIRVFNESAGLYPDALSEAAGDYLFQEITSGDAFAATGEAQRLADEFGKHLAVKGREQAFAEAAGSLAGHPASRLELIRDWTRGFLRTREGGAAYVEEVAARLFCGEEVRWQVAESRTRTEVEGMRGSHPVIAKDLYQFDFLEFGEKLAKFEREVVPRFERYHALKQQFLERERKALRLDEFKPRVLTSFVRSQLIDHVYLPMVGDNLAKQIGVAGSQKRTDVMGMLLLISPPGYGKTTLIEYVASRLGLNFIKINGPAIGHNVTSLDPEEAPNAAAREEIQKLNLAFEMGDNVLVCLDDIQHTNTEFLQKFISLCDGQRRIEGVWRKQPRTYDLRGRKVAVVMAGNPYTESGQKFKIPDMLSNRADTYNLGDIIGGNADYFKASYIENAVTSNAALAPLANRSQKDIRVFIRMAETGERDGSGFEAAYSAQELEEILLVMKKLVLIRDVVLRVNQEYIHSAAQADEFRTEPPFKLQGSYRNMNRLAEKVVAIMNDDEVRALVLDHYRGESQTLTTGAEANFLKFKEMMGWLTPEENARWEEIKKTFRRNQVTRGVDQGDSVGRVVAQLASVQSGLEGIQDALQRQFSGEVPKLVVDFAPLQPSLEALRSTMERLDRRDGSAGKDGTEPPAEWARVLDGFRKELSQAITAVHSGAAAERLSNMSHEVKVLHRMLSSIQDVAAQQRNHLRNVEELLVARAREGTVELELTQEMLSNERAFLERVQEVIAEANQPEAPKKDGNGEQTSI